MAVQTEEQRRAAKLQVVRKLLTRAAHRETPEAEAESCRRKAEELMVSFAIEEHHLRQAEESEQLRTRPVARWFSVEFYWDDTDVFGTNLWTMFMDIADHCRLVLGPMEQRVVEGRGETGFQMVGFEADIEYFDMLFTAVLLDFVDKLRPRYDVNRTRIENIIVLKECGYKWDKICAEMGVVYTKPNAIKIYAEYRAYCQETGRTQQKTMPKTFQRSFAMGYASTVGRRLREMRHGIEAAGGNSMALALRDIRQVVSEAVYDLFPGWGGHEKGTVEKRRQWKIDGHAVGHGIQAGSRVDLSVNQNQRVGKTPEIGA